MVSNVPAQQILIGNWLQMFPWTRSAERAIDIEFSEPTWHHVADEVSRTNKGLAERITELHRNLCSKFPRIEDFMSGKAVMYELINNMMMSSKMRWIRTLTSFAFLADFEREELIEVFPWIKDLWESSFLVRGETQIWHLRSVNAMFEHRTPQIHALVGELKASCSA
ncbi:unnamed protein product [Toxocara canis]|uniref:Cucumopine_C domain-containing protein n=1 Tax=Toxocara canis TaxID=6265 RepID=A0A183V5Y1_TOXCA|nr:unnamed protein product [Toxocara canis]